jgi:hypothetical protein
MSELLFPIDKAEAYFREACSDFQRHENVLRWRHGDGITEFRVEPIEYHTHDELLVSELVTIEHHSDALDSVDVSYANYLNMWATLSAIIPSDGTQPARLISKVGIFSTDREAAERVYAPLMCTEAVIVGWHAARLARGEFRLDPEQSPLSKTDDPAPYGLADFQAVKMNADRVGLIAAADDGECWCEFPWDPGAASHLFRQQSEALLESGKYTAEELERLSGRTMLFSATTKHPHPLYGNGILCRLELPLPRDAPYASTIVDQLNRWELRRPDLPPLYGAWCIGPRAPTFVTYLPNQFCLPGLVPNLLAWSEQRARRVQALLEQGMDPGDWIDGLEQTKAT